MTFEEYNEYIKQVNIHLQKIAERTSNQAFLGTANSSNPMFVELMQRQVYLTKLSSEITERMVAMMSSNNS